MMKLHSKTETYLSKCSFVFHCNDKLNKCKFCYGVLVHAEIGVRVSVYSCVRVCACPCIRVSICTCAHVSVCRCICVSVCPRVRLSLCPCVRVYINIYVCLPLSSAYLNNTHICPNKFDGYYDGNT